MQPTHVRTPRPNLSESESTVNVPTSEWQRLRGLRIPAVTLGVVVLAAACGGSGKANSTGAVAASPAAARPSGSPSARPGTTGKISAVNPTNIFVQNDQSQSQTTVDFSASTTFSQTITATAAALKVGDCVTASAVTAGARPTARPSAQPSARPSRAPVTALTATNVVITATTGNCARGNGGFGGGNPSARPSFRPSARPSGAARAGGGGAGFGFGATTFGTVASVGDGSFVVTSTRGTSSSTSTTKVTVTTTSATTYRETETVTKANLKVGLCATAIGTTDDTGAVNARTIALSTPTSSGCSVGFGGFGGGRGRFGGAGAAAGGGG
jgi:hypothetical protein